MLEIQSNNPKLTIEEIEKFEQNNAITLPSEYKSFLLKYNGGYPMQSNFYIHGSNGDFESILNIFYGIGDMYDNLQKNIDFLDELFEVGFIPIADDPGGNQICICISEKNFGEIRFWEHELGNENELDNLLFVSKSFSVFIDSLFD